MRLRALIWDVDGTLAETEDLGHRVAYNRAFEEAGLDWHWDRATYGELLAVAGGKERLRAWWARRHGPQLACDEALIRRLYARKTEHYLALLDRGAITLRPGVEALLRAARGAGLRQAIATTTAPENVLRLVDRTLGPEALEGFEVIGAGDLVPAKKPAPDIYEWVLRRLDLEPGAALAIEDSAIGALSAIGAGVPVVVARSAYTADDVLPAGIRADWPSLAGVDLPALAAAHEAGIATRATPSWPR